METKKRYKCKNQHSEKAQFFRYSLMNLAMVQVTVSFCQEMARGGAKLRQYYTGPGPNFRYFRGRDLPAPNGRLSGRGEHENESRSWSFAVAAEHGPELIRVRYGHDSDGGEAVASGAPMRRL